MYNNLLLDVIYTESRRILYRNAAWRYGQNRVKETTEMFLKNLLPFTQIKGKSYMDVGCGRHHPYGNSAVMILNGAKSSISFDIDTIDKTRSSEALYDLLTDAAANPSNYHHASLSTEEYYKNLSQFNIEALKTGDLENGLKNLPMEFLRGNIHDLKIKDNTIDLTTSRAVLEHFLDFPKAMQNLYRVMSPGAVGFHRIDIVDHRYYYKPEKYNKWSFLTEDENWTDNLCNRLRASEIRSIFENTGFEILQYDLIKEPLPTGLRSKLKGRFKEMSDDELSVTVIDCVIKKP